MENNIRKRKVTTMDDILLLIDDLIDESDEVINNIKRKQVKPGIRYHTTRKNKLKNIRKRIPKILNKKVKKPKNPNRKSGFTIKKAISPELAEFLDVEDDTLLSQTEVLRALRAYIFLSEDEERETMKVWSYLNEEGRDLRDQNNKRNILPDDTLADLLHYDEYKEKVRNGEETRLRKNKETGEKERIVLEDDSLNWQCLTKLIQIHFIKVK